MRVFLTGATGYLGGRTLDRLLAGGVEVVALVRNPARLAPRPGLRVVGGSLERIGERSADLAGCDVVLHLAGVVDTWGAPDTFDRVVVRGTRDLVTAAGRAGVRRFVHVSSEAVHQSGRPLLDIDETASLPVRPSSAYGDAKRRAEAAVLEHFGPMTRVVLRPTFVWGATSPQLVALIERARLGRLPLLDGGRASFEHVHVDNVAQALVAACHRGADGARYLVTNGEPMPIGEFLGGILDAVGVDRPRRSVPSRPLYAAAHAAEATWRTFRLPGRPPLTRFEVEFLSLPRRYRIDHARAELGYHPEVTYRDGLAELTRAALDGSRT